MRLVPGEAQVWSGAISGQESGLGTYEGWLSAEEKSRAGRFHFPSDRKRYLVCRGLLRRLVSGYLGVNPGSLDFRSGKAGKPRLAAPSADLRFNLSHSGDKVLIAFTLGREVGVDLECLRQDVPVDPIARACFSLRDRASLAAAAPEARLTVFFRLWTRMEAGLKAAGWGLAQWQDLLAGSPAEAEGLKAGAVYDLNGQPGYAAALAVGPAPDAPAPVIRIFQLPDHLERTA